MQFKLILIQGLIRPGHLFGRPVSVLCICLKGFYGQSHQSTPKSVWDLVAKKQKKNMLTFGIALNYLKLNVLLKQKSYILKWLDMFGFKDQKKRKNLVF